MYVSVFVCMCVHIYVRFVHTKICMYVWLSLCVCTYACAFVRVCLYACRRHNARHLYVCMHVCMSVCVCMACGAVSCSSINTCDCVACDNCSCYCRPYPLLLPPPTTATPAPCLLLPLLPCQLLPLLPPLFLPPRLVHLRLSEWGCITPALCAHWTLYM